MFKTKQKKLNQYKMNIHDKKYDGDPFCPLKRISSVMDKSEKKL